MSKTIAIIGHVDHGKTSLVKALTGRDTDRLKEENERGLSIALGFATYTTASGKLFLIDAPGHSDFIRTTASGLSGADAALLVVSAIDGVAPQTREHLKLAHFYGIQCAIVAINKCDLATPEQIASCELAVRQMLAGLSDGSPTIVEVSCGSKPNLNDLRSALENFAAAKIERTKLPGFFVPIDRVFSMKGAGTVVTGTVQGAPISLDCEASIEPAGLTASIRSFESDGADVTSAAPGERVAINLRNTDVSLIKRGDVLCQRGVFASSLRLDVMLTVSRNLKRPLKHMEELEVLIGTSHRMAHLRMLSPTPKSSVQSFGFAQLIFRTPVVSFPGQRVILRRPSELTTIGGARVLDPNPVSARRDKSKHAAVLNALANESTRDVANALADRDVGLVDIAWMTRCGADLEPDLGERLGDAFYIYSDNLALRLDEVKAVEQALLAKVQQFHLDHPCRPLMPREALIDHKFRYALPMIEVALANLQSSSRLTAETSGFVLSGHDANAVMQDGYRDKYDALDERIRAMGLKPTSPFGSGGQTEALEDLLELLIWNRKVVRLYNHALKHTLYLHTDTISRAHGRLNEMFPNGQTFTTSAARTALDTNRKTIVPLLEYFDAVGVTERHDDERWLCD